jgi:DNA-binding PadR family transcriptional regulator
MRRWEESDRFFGPGGPAALFWMARHRRGHGHFARGFMGGGFGGSGFRTGRKLAAEDLQLVLLALLAEKPSHGYELMKALEERSGGFYSPSPGVIYPALTYLEELGYAVVELDGSKKLYHITDKGRGYLEQNREAVDDIFRQLDRIASRMDHVRRAFAGDDESEDDSFGPSELRLARRELKRALHEKKRCSPEEARRIADILRQAATDIRGSK